VSFSPIFYKQLFCMKVFCAALMCLQFMFVIFWQKLLIKCWWNWHQGIIFSVSCTRKVLKQTLRAKWGCPTEGRFDSWYIFTTFFDTDCPQITFCLHSFHYSSRTYVDIYNPKSFLHQSPCHIQLKDLRYKTFLFIQINLSLSVTSTLSYCFQTRLEPTRVKHKTPP
jgi:hypothetical protein